MRSDYIKPSAYRQIYRYMTYANELALRVSLTTGLRIGDVLKIRAEDLKGRTLHFVSEKTDKPGTKVLPLALAAELRRQAGSGGYVFKHRTDPTKHRTRQTVWADVKRAARAAGMRENFTPHSARKTYAVELYHEQGLSAAEEALQHDSTTTTMLYALSDVLSASQGGGAALAGVDLAAVENAAYRGAQRALHDFARECGLTFSRK